MNESDVNRLIKAMGNLTEAVKSITSGISGLGWIALWLFIIMCLLCSRMPQANAADYAIVSFDSPEHLAALQDSVVGVRDSVKVTEDRRIDDGIWEMEWHWQITYRHLVGVTVSPEVFADTVWSSIDNNNRPKPWAEILSIRFFYEAIIFYEKVRQ